MVPELGHVALWLALALAVLQSTLPLLGAWRQQIRWMASAAPLSVASFTFIAFAFWLLTVAFVQDDFSVALVANHSNSLLPVYYKISAVWGNHEGSMLMWVLILGLWSSLVAWRSKGLPLEVSSRVLAILGWISVGFLLFILLTSNPFDRLLPAIPAEGKDLNPLLQDIGLILHPPLLYTGYVGFAVAFAFAIAALIGGRLDAAWARWSRPWCNVAWAFLTVGIVLGSWWAYYELGWGGWWFWDPVENASFMPWLAGTALIHSLAVTEKRGMFKSWTLLLAIFAFSLSLLGTFLVRSGVLTSVHAFAVDPERGLFILGFLGFVVGGSLTLYALRAPVVKSQGGFRATSREALLLINNIVLLVATLTVLFGTLFPLLMDALSLGKYSVGAPYFNALFVPLMALLIVFMAAGPLANWKQTRAERFRRLLVIPAVASAITGPLLVGLSDFEWNGWAALAVSFSAWLVCASVMDLRDKLRHRKGDLWSALRRLGASYWGMQLAHMGLAVSVIGVCLVSQYGVQHDVRMVVGDQHEVAGYRFTLQKLQPLRGPNYQGTEGVVEVHDGERLITILYPQKRDYFAQPGNMMTEAGIDAGFTRDLFVALGEPLDDGVWAVRVQVKPFIRWIWLGGLMMTLGGLLAAFDKRYRRQNRRGLSSSVTGEMA